MKQPANDVWFHLGNHKYLDVVWNSRGTWSVLVHGKRLGYWPTRRLAKKAAKAALAKIGTTSG